MKKWEATALYLSGDNLSRTVAVVVQVPDKKSPQANRRSIVYSMSVVEARALAASLIQMADRVATYVD